MRATEPAPAIVMLIPMAGLLLAAACTVRRPAAPAAEPAAPDDAAGSAVADVTQGPGSMASTAVEVLPFVRERQVMPHARSPVEIEPMMPTSPQPILVEAPTSASVLVLPALPAPVASDHAAAFPIGLAMVVLGMALAFLAFWRWAGRKRSIPRAPARALVRRDPVLSRRRQPVAVTTAAVASTPAPPAVGTSGNDSAAAHTFSGVCHQRRWHLQGVEADTWAGWFDRAGVDMSQGILLDLARAVDEPAAAPHPLPAAPAVTTWEGLQAMLDQRLGEAVCRLKPAFASSVPDLVALQEPLPAAVVERLWTAMGDIPDNGMTRWLWVNILRLARFRLAAVDRSHVEEEAVALTFLEVDTGSDQEPTAADWEALRLRLRLTAVVCLGGAARHLGLARLRATYDALPQRHTAIVRRAWIDVLLAWGALQQGGAALQRFVEAEALCQQLIDEGVARASSHCLLVRVLLGRAGSESGGLRSATLQRAAGLANATFCEAATPEAALAVAEVAMARSTCAAEDAIGPLLEQALQHAFIAARHPDHVAAALQIRLAAQLSHEALPGASVQGNAADALCRQLERMPGLSAPAWRHIVQLHLRQGRYAQACRAGARAAECGHAHRELLQLWERASSEWRNTRPHADEHRQWQDNARARQAVAASL